MNNDVRDGLIRLARAMRKTKRMDSGHDVLMLAVDEIDILRAELTLARTAARGRAVPRIKIRGAP